jgi:hypothetical protein
VGEPRIRDQLLNRRRRRDNKKTISNPQPEHFGIARDSPFRTRADTAVTSHVGGARHLRTGGAAFQSGGAALSNRGSGADVAGAALQSGGAALQSEGAALTWALVAYPPELEIIVH